MLKQTTLNLKLGLKKVDGLDLETFVGQPDFLCICPDQVVYLYDEKILASFLVNLKIFLKLKTLL